MTTKKNKAFILDINWIAGQAPGAFRDSDFNFPSLYFAPDLTLQDFVGKVTITVVEDGVVLRGELAAKTELKCTRCLEVFFQPLEISFVEMYSLSRSKEEVGVEELPFPPDGHIDLEPIFREYALINIPIRHVCSEDCKGLCPICGANRNKVVCDHSEERIDPRMAKLKQFLDKD